MEILIITGLSGAGKSSAVNALEDIGYFCVDNLPPMLMPKFLELCKNSMNNINKVAFVIDSRSGRLLDSFADILSEMKEENYRFRLIFLDARDDIIVRRYKEPRRRHPLLQKADNSLERCVEMEREALQTLRGMADVIIDTSDLSPTALRDKMLSSFLSNSREGMSIHCVSFGFKYGIPIESDLVFDVRFLKNPFYVPELKHKTGLDRDVFDYVMDDDVTVNFKKRMLDLIEYMLPYYKEEGKSSLVISVGCTGGHHRSVAMAETIKDFLAEKNYLVSVEHRDINK